MPARTLPGPERLPERVYRRIDVDEDTGCWVWRRPNGNGYGYIDIDGKRVLVHRLVYETLVGEIPKGLQIDHLCRNRACTNPEHLEPVTRAENIRRGAAAITHCRHGHPYTAENTRRNRLGHRYCGLCARGRMRRQADAKRRSNGYPATQIQSLDVLARLGPISIRDFAEVIGRSLHTGKVRLELLLPHGLVERERGGKSRGGWYWHYSITERGLEVLAEARKAGWTPEGWPA